MPKSIGGYSPEAVIAAIEENLVGASTSLGRSEDGVIFRGADVTWVYTGHRSLSRVLRARFADDEAEDRVAEICDCFREWDAPVSWVIGPTSWPPQLPALLQGSGFDAGRVWTALAREIPPQGLDPIGGVPLPKGLEIELATATTALADWTTVNGDPADTDPAGGGDASASPDIFSPDNAGSDPRCRFYLATLAGRPVARGMSYLSGDVVGLYWFAVATEHRDEPFDAAIAARALADARSAGARLAVIPTGGLLHQIGVKLGFRPYCQFHVHAWPPATMSHA